MNEQTKVEVHLPVVGKDVLELLSTAMYLDPLTIYREYVQNAADSIDAARESGELLPDEGAIEIGIDPAKREIRICDNGTGVVAGDFEAIITAIGGSGKRGTEARGFRGVGRLSGLAYARELSFRTSAAGEAVVSSIKWDCLALRRILRDPTDQRDLSRVIKAITNVERSSGDEDEHFFEVILSGVPRLGDDRLLSPEKVSNYLSQIAPLPFAADFSFAKEIAEKLRELGGAKPLDIRLNGGEPLRRPFSDQIEVSGGKPIRLRGIKFVEIPSVDGSIAAVVWVAHHDYEGAVSSATLVKGLRARAGDVQVGTGELFREIFPEARFNSWTIGEVHVLDKRIVPNGRRDAFEANTHFANLLNHLSPLGREIGMLCRTSSRERKILRDIELAYEGGLQTLDVMRQGSLTERKVDELALSVELAILKIEKLARGTQTSMDEPNGTHPYAVSLRKQLEEYSDRGTPESPLDRMPEAKRSFYEEMFTLIYECSSNQASAKSLVDRIMLKLA